MNKPHFLSFNFSKIKTIHLQLILFFIFSNQFVFAQSKHFTSSIGQYSKSYWNTSTTHEFGANNSISVNFALLLDISNEYTECPELEIEPIYLGYRVYTDLSQYNFISLPNIMLPFAGNLILAGGAPYSSNQLNNGIPFTGAYDNIISTPVLDQLDLYDISPGYNTYVSEVSLNLTFPFSCNYNVFTQYGSVHYGSRNYIELKLFKKVNKNSYVLHDLANIEIIETPHCPYQQYSSFTVMDQANMWANGGDHLRDWIAYDYICGSLRTQEEPGTKNNSSYIDATLSPNPVSDQATIRFDLAADDLVFTQIMDINGKIVKTILTNKRFSTGPNELSFDSSELSSGIYFCKIQAQDASQISTIKFVKL